ncbi:hypothetical protein D6774_00250 [Candidatus Woesearchaeota archaeon]|nr:MAG: hypothetical protein D6774_00250 [Candidatus Woesearchaeota archaeon]
MRRLVAVMTVLISSCAYPEAYSSRCKQVQFTPFIEHQLRHSYDPILELIERDELQIAGEVGGIAYCKRKRLVFEEVPNKYSERFETLCLADQHKLYNELSALEMQLGHTTVIDPTLSREELLEQIRKHYDNLYTPQQELLESGRRTTKKWPFHLHNTLDPPSQQDLQATIPFLVISHTRKDDVLRYTVFSVEEGNVRQHETVIVPLLKEK